MIGDRGGVHIIKMCRQDYEGFGERIGMKTLQSITLNDNGD